MSVNYSWRIPCTVRWLAMDSLASFHLRRYRLGVSIFLRHVMDLIDRKFPQHALLLST